MKDQADTLRLQIDLSEIDRLREENARLRERVAELQKESDSNAAVAMDRGLQLRQKIELEALLLEAVRWLNENRDGTIETPERLAPLIAEAGEKQP